MGYKNRKGEHGNVLFLILIAVALFAALSYAVTQSTRGGGNADDETSLISSAALTQYPASLKTTILRMSITDGVGDDELMFNPPSDITDCESDADAPLAGPEACVFGSNGGSGSYQIAPSDTTTSVGTGVWIYNGDNEIQDIGSTAGGDAPTLLTHEIIAFLSDLTTGICIKINEELGIGSTIPVETNIDVTTYLDDLTNGDAPVAGGGTIGADVPALDGQPFGCFEQGGVNHYYHTLSEN